MRHETKSVTASGVKNQDNSRLQSFGVAAVHSRQVRRYAERGVLKYRVSGHNSFSNYKMAHVRNKL
jgi:hypothetical protein